MARRMGIFLTFVVIASLATAARSYFLVADSASEMTSAAIRFVHSLSDEQRQVAVMPFDTPQRVDWHFIPKETRKGLQFKHMTDTQRKAALDLLRAALSQIGYDKATHIMAFEAVLKELEKGRTGGPLRDTERYYYTLFGNPSSESRWGLSIEGHHLSLNFVVEGHHVVSSTPAVFAANPATLMSDVAGEKKGTRILAKEESLAFDLLAALSPEQRQIATIAEVAPKEVRAPGEAQPPADPPVGLAAGKMNDGQRKLLRALIEVYALNMTDDVAHARLAAIDHAGMDHVHFAWAGPDRPGVGHYYRVQGPTFLIEFVNTQPDAAGNPANHIHCLWRDMRGDFGISR